MSVMAILHHLRSGSLRLYDIMIASQWFLAASDANGLWWQLQFSAFW